MLSFLLSSLLQVSTLLLAASAHAGASGIQWQPCPKDIVENATLPVECATLAVPLDYSAVKGTEILNLSLVRVPAIKQPATNSILLNFGGPGLETRHQLANQASSYQALTGGEHDLVTWDPRGVADTLTFSCFNSTADSVAMLSKIGLAKSSDVERGVSWAAAKNFADACAKHPEAQKRAPLISTTFAARDAMQIVDALEEDGLIRYLGFSYGTVIGAILAAMFPDRIDRVVLDGVLNPTEYFYGMSSIEQFASADATLLKLFHDCISAPELCTLAQHHPNVTAAQLASAVYELLDEVKYRPIAYQGQILGYPELAAAIRHALYAPTGWHYLDLGLNAFLAEPRNDTLAATILEAALVLVSNAEGESGDDALIGITCVDKKHRTNSYDDYAASLDEAQSVSRLLGDTTVVPAVCSQWKLEPRERFTGRFEDVKPRNPLLIIGNTYDPITSIVSARNISETIQGSGFLEHGGVGHTSMAQPSLCTARAIQEYFHNGTLPEPNTVCKPAEVNAFRAASGPTWPDLFPQLGFPQLGLHPGSNSTNKAALVKRHGTLEDPVVKLGRLQAATFR